VANGDWAALGQLALFREFATFLVCSNSQFEFLGRVEREVAVEALEHEGEEMGPTGKTQIARQRPQIIKEGLAAY